MLVACGLVTRFGCKGCENWLLGVSAVKDARSGVIDLLAGVGCCRADKEDGMDGCRG